MQSTILFLQIQKLLRKLVFQCVGKHAMNILSTLMYRRIKSLGQKLKRKLRRKKQAFQVEVENTIMIIKKTIKIQINELQEATLKIYNTLKFEQ